MSDKESELIAKIQETRKNIVDLEGQLVELRYELAAHFCPFSEGEIICNSDKKEKIKRARFKKALPPLIGFKGYRLLVHQIKKDGTDYALATETYSYTNQHWSLESSKAS